MRNVRLIRPATLAPALALVALGGCMGDNRGVDTIHQPVVTQGPKGTTAAVPGCPDWSRSSQPEFQGSTTSDYGCSVKTNLAAMIADPMDLVRGREGDGTDAFTAQKAVRSWRETPNTGRAGLEKITVGAPK